MLIAFVLFLVIRTAEDQCAADKSLMQGFQVLADQC